MQKQAMCPKAEECSYWKRLRESPLGGEEAGIPCYSSTSCYQCNYFLISEYFGFYPAPFIEAYSID